MMHESAELAEDARIIRVDADEQAYTRPYNEVHDQNDRNDLHNL